MASLTSDIRAAVADPKNAPMGALSSALDFRDDIAAEDVELIAEEYARRGGDSSVMGFDWEPPQYL